MTFLVCDETNETNGKGIESEFTSDRNTPKKNVLQMGGRKNFEFGTSFDFYWAVYAGDELS